MTFSMTTAARAALAFALISVGSAAVAQGAPPAKKPTVGGKPQEVISSILSLSSRGPGSNPMGGLTRQRIFGDRVMGARSWRMIKRVLFAV
jgi:hypothetical protein